MPQIPTYIGKRYIITPTTANVVLSIINPLNVAPVAMIANGNLIFSKKWQCSVTTIKHVKAFIEDYVPFWKSILSIDYLRKAVDNGEIGLIAEIN